VADPVHLSKVRYFELAAGCGVMAACTQGEKSEAAGDRSSATSSPGANSFAIASGLRNAAAAVTMRFSGYGCTACEASQERGSGNVVVAGRLNGTADIVGNNPPFGSTALKRCQ
jgi:hypothetical protein